VNLGRDPPSTPPVLPAQGDPPTTPAAIPTSDNPLRVPATCLRPSKYLPSRLVAFKDAQNTQEPDIEDVIPTTSNSRASAADFFPSITEGTLRRAFTDSTPTTTEDVLIIDCAADQSCIGRGFKILYHTGEEIRLNGAIAGMRGGVFPIVCAAAIAIDPTTTQEYIIIIHQAAYNPDLAQHESLLHSDQARHHGVKVNDLADCYMDGHGNPGLQNLQIEEHCIPLCHDGSKCFIRVREPTQIEWDTHVLLELTSPEPWGMFTAQPRRISRDHSFSPAKLSEWKRRLGNVPDAIVLHTLQNSTQLVDSVEAETRSTPRRHYICRLPMLRPRRLNEGFFTDPFFPAETSVRGYNVAQMFRGDKSGFLFVEFTKGKGYAPCTLQNFIRTVGAPAYISSDNALEETGGEWGAICRTTCITQRTSETEQQNQNKVERTIQDIKRKTKLIIDMNDAPTKFWCYAVAYAVELSNHTAAKRIGWKTPYELHFGDTPDISVFRFTFWEPIYYHDPHARFPNPNLLPARFLGIARTTGDAFTFYIYTQKEQGRNVVLARSVIRKRHEDEPKTAMDYEPLPAELESEGHADSNNNNEVSSASRTEEEEAAVTMTTLARTNLIADILRVAQDSTNELDPETVSERDKAIQRILDANPEEIILGDKLAAYEGTEEHTGDHIWHLEDGTYVHMRTDEIYDHIASDTKMEEIDQLIGHQISTVTGKLYILVRWDTGNSTLIEASLLQRDEPHRLATFIRSNPVERSRNGFWNKWALHMIASISRAARRLKTMYEPFIDDTNGNLLFRKTRRVLRRTTKHKTGQPYQSEPAIVLGIAVPRNPAEAAAFDRANGNTLWAESTKKETDGIQEHGTLEFLPPGSVPPVGYQKAPLRTIYDIKHDLRRKTRIVIGGHKVDATGLSRYSSVVQLASIRLLNIIAKSQNLQCLAGDIGNAYLNAETKEKVYVVIGLEFGPELEGRIAIVRKGLYGLKTSGNAWHSHFANTLHSMGFTPTRFDPDVWLRQRDDGTGYDYISTYVDDFLITARDPWPFMKQLQEVYKIKDPGPPTTYLGALYTGDPSGTWTINCKDYIKAALIQVQSMIGGDIRDSVTPCATGDHPEEDTSEILSNQRHREYQSMAGMAQWLTTLGRFDICYAVSSLSRFCSCPREGHYQRMIRLWGYLKKYPDKSIAIDARDPIYAPEHGAELKPDFADQYSYATDAFDERFPEPLGKELPVTIFFDSDHAHDKVTGRSISGVLTMVGRTPVIWKSKRQGAVQTSTYGAEFSAMRLATEEAHTIRYMLRSLGIKVNNPCRLYGDNLGVIQNATMPEGTLKKKHVALSYHFVREAVAVNVISAFKVPGKDNFADVMTKSLERNGFMHHTCGILWASSTNP